MIFLILPLVIYAIVALMPPGKPAVIAVAVTGAFLVLMYLNPGGDDGGSNDPHAGIGEGLGMILFMLCVGGWGAGAGVQVLRRIMALSRSAYVATVIIAPMLLFGIFLLFLG